MTMDTDNSLHGTVVVTDGYYKLCVHMVYHNNDPKLSIQGQSLRIKMTINKSQCDTLKIFMLFIN